MFEAAGNGIPTVHIKKSQHSNPMIKVFVGDRMCLLVKKTHRADPLATIPIEPVRTRKTPSDVKAAGARVSVVLFVVLSHIIYNDKTHNIILLEEIPRWTFWDIFAG